MELQELQNIWAEYDRKLDRSLQVNLQLLKQFKFDKAKRKLSKVFYLKVIEVLMLVPSIVYFGNFAFENWRIPQFSLSAIAIGALFILFLVYVIKQLVIIRQVEMGFDHSVTPIQKKIEQLKLSIVIYVKYILILFPLYPLLLMLAGKIVFNVDFMGSAYKAYFLANVAVDIILLPLALWLMNQLTAKNINSIAAKTLLTGSGWFQANAAADFLKEIEAFEQEG